ncbi:hypothetical protein [Streptomyces sp. MH60]|uniref:hypothetical protein n=1 Tax=Streptomyces sp. MH60 TaxID=1940758 RepID=UPI000CEE94F6|nr:hypothetical protein [Streptomyces sp. MH60]PPS68724.1 hypothetical protein BZZ08_07380 [Streptomyces sp. MH60]
MRTHHRDEERESAAASRRTVRRPEQDPGTARLLGLQESAGNDAVTESLRRSGHPGALHGAPVQRAPKRGHEESTEGEIDPLAVSTLGQQLGHEDTYKGGRGRKLPKDREQAACWEWAVRAATDDTGISHGDCWEYLTSMPFVDDSKLDQLAPAVKAELGQLRASITAAGLAFDPDRMRPPAEGDVRPFMEQSMRAFVTSHGLRIATDRPAAWVVCNYKVSAGVAAPDHFWIELPDPNTGARVVLQTVPDIPYVEAGGPELRWHEKDSVKERQSEHEEHRKIEVPVAALKGRHTQIINGILETGRRTRAKAGRA